MIKLGEKIQDFEVLLTGDKHAKLSDYQGEYLILYFYPKASTPGCTIESCDFSELFPKFSKMNANILGVSRDSLKRQENFKSKFNFAFDLIADTEESLCNYFGVIQEKKNYGKTYIGIVRSTFVVDPKGTLIKEWRNLRVKNHALEVYEFLEGLA